MNHTLGPQNQDGRLVSHNTGRYWLSFHAQKRMGTRGISQDAIQAVLAYGRVVFVRGAKIFVVGRKEAERYQHCGIDLFRCEGVHVVCTPKGTTIITTYRNRDLRDLRPLRKPRKRRWR